LLQTYLSCGGRECAALDGAKGAYSEHGEYVRLEKRRNMELDMNMELGVERRLTGETEHLLAFGTDLAAPIVAIGALGFRLNFARCGPRHLAVSFGYWPAELNSFDVLLFT
jgi:hypothetical protein